MGETAGEIAKALSMDARVVVMDEPTSSLTPTEVALLFAVIRRLTSLGIAVLYVTHKLDEVFEIANTVTVLRAGRQLSTKPDDGLRNTGLRGQRTQRVTCAAVGTRQHERKGGQ